MKKILVSLLLINTLAMTSNVQAQTSLHTTNPIHAPLKIDPESASDHYFDTALTDFQHKKTEQCARQIMDGVEALRTEAPNAAAPGERKILYQRLNELITLSEQVEAGNVHDNDVLLTAFSNAQISVIHRYYLLSNDLIEPGGDDITQLHIDNLRHHILAEAKYAGPGKSANLYAIAEKAETLSYQIGQLKGKPLTPALTASLKVFLQQVKALEE